MFDRHVYKCELLSITPDITVYNDLSMKKNIMNAKTEVVANILVQKSWREDYLREIITNKLIPIYYVTKFETTTNTNGKIINDPPKSGIFVKINKIIGDEGLILESSLEPATIDEVKKYAFDYIDTDKYAEKIYELFNNANKYYQEAQEKGLVSEETQIKRMVKAIKRCKNI